MYSKKIHSNSTFNQYVSAIYKVLGAFLFGGAVSQSLTDLAKYTIGRPRPHFLTVCAPKVCKGYVAVINCTGDPSVVTEARYVSHCKCFNILISVNFFWNCMWFVCHRLSFYSGHSSFGMYCMLFLAVSAIAAKCWHVKHLKGSWTEKSKLPCHHCTIKTSCKFQNSKLSF